MKLTNLPQLLLAASLTAGTLSAQQFIEPPHPFTTQTHVGEGGYHTAHGWAYPSSHTGTTIHENNSSRMVVNVWETSIEVGGVTKATSFLEYRDHKGSIPPGGTHILTSGILPTNSYVQNPDVEFAEDISSFFVSFSDANGLWLQRWNDIGGGIYQPGITTNISTNAYTLDQNLDFVERTNLTGTPGGALTWQENTNILARTFNYDPILGVINLGTVTSLGPGRYPDIAIHSGMDQYAVTYMNPNTNSVIVESDLYTNLTAGISPPTTYTSSGITYVGYPRIATPHNLTGSMDYRDWTVVTKAINGTQSMIRGITFDASTTSITDYDISIGAGTSINRNPAVCYNSDRIKFIWTSDYTTGSSWTQPVTSTQKDILLCEMDLNYIIIPSTGVIQPSEFWEINYDPSWTEQYWNAFPSIAETRNKSTSYVNTDYNVYMYASDATTSGQPYYSVFNKVQFNKQDPKRQGLPEKNELSLSLMDHEYIIEGQNLNKFKYILTNIKGQRINIQNQMDISDDMVLINCSNLNSGLYFLHCTSDQLSETFKLLVK